MLRLPWPMFKAQKAAVPTSPEAPLRPASVRLEGPFVRNTALRFWDQAAPSSNLSFDRPPLGGSAVHAASHAPPEVGRASIPEPGVDAPLSFRSWALRAHLKFIKARTPFSAFLSQSLHLCRRGVSAPAHVLFPLPLPFPAIFRSRPSLSSRRRAVVAERRLLHVLVMALNFLRQDCHFVPLGLLQRPPNKPHARGHTVASRTV